MELLLREGAVYFVVYVSPVPLWPFLHDHRFSPSPKTHNERTNDNPPGRISLNQEPAFQHR